MWKLSWYESAVTIRSCVFVSRADRCAGGIRNRESSGSNSKSGDGANISVETNVSYDSQADTVMQRRILVHFDGLDYIISEITDEGISLYG